MAGDEKRGAVKLIFVDVKTGPLERHFERLGVRVRVTPRGGWRWSGEIDAMVDWIWSASCGERVGG